MQREREEARWRDDQQHQEYNTDAQGATSKHTAAIDTCANSNTQNRVSTLRRSTLRIDTSLAVRSLQPMTRATVTSEHQPQASTSFAVLPEGSRLRSTSSRRVPGPSTDHDRQKKSMRELASDPRRTDPMLDRSLRKRNIKLWREKVEVPSGAQETLVEPRVKERPSRIPHPTSMICIDSQPLQRRSNGSRENASDRLNTASCYWPSTQLPVTYLSPRNATGTKRNAL